MRVYQVQNGELKSEEIQEDKWPIYNMTGWAKTPEEAWELDRKLTEEHLKQAGVKLAWDYINEDEKFWDFSFRVSMSVEATSKPVVMLINADNYEAALNFAVNHLEEQELEGFFLINEEIEEQESEGIQLTFAGDHSRALARPDLIHIEKLD